MVGLLGAGAGSEPDDDEGCVVDGAVGWEEVEEDRVGEGFGVGAPVAGEGVGEAGDARIDVFVATFDESVGVEDEGVAFREAGAGLGPGVWSGRAPNGGSVAWSRNSTPPWARSRAGGGWPALL